MDTNEFDENISKLNEYRRLFNAKDISFDIYNFSIRSILDAINDDEIDLFPDFQRSFNLWNNSKKSQLIESLLLNFPVPPLYFATIDYKKTVVVDGLQRLSTIKSFISKDGFKIVGLTVLSELNGETFYSLRREHQRRILEFTFTTFQLRPGISHFVIYDLYRRLNTGSVALNAQEVRHSQNVESTKILRTFTDLDIFNKLVRVAKNRLADQELSLRFIALFEKKEEMLAMPSSHILDSVMEDLKFRNIQHINNLRSRFEESLSLIEFLLGENAFYWGKSRLSFKKQLFEVLTISCAKLSSKEMGALKTSKDIFKEQYNEILKVKEFVSSINSEMSHLNRVKYIYIQELISRFI